MKKFNVRLPFYVRQGLNVAERVVEEIFDCMPAALAFEGKRNENRDKEDIVSVAFEGGTKIVVSLYNLSQLDECWRKSPEYWVVTEVVAFYYDEDGKKQSKIFDDKKLLELKDRKNWHRPEVKSIENIKGFIAIFWNTGERTGYVEVDPQRNQDGFYSQMETFPYSPLVEGNKEKVIQEAEKRLEEYYK